MRDAANDVLFARSVASLDVVDDHERWTQIWMGSGHQKGGSVPLSREPEPYDAHPVLRLRTPGGLEQEAAATNSCRSFDDEQRAASTAAAGGAADGVGDPVQLAVALEQWRMPRGAALISDGDHVGQHLSAFAPGRQWAAG